MQSIKPIVLGLGLAFGVAAGAQAATLNTLYVDGGSFLMGVFTGSPNPITGSTHNLIGAYNAPGWNTSAAQSAAAPSSIASFNFNNGGTWVNTYTAAAATQAGVAGGGPAPSGTAGGATIANGDAITVDLSSFFANWNGTDFSQGSAAATGTISAVSGNNFNYTLNWTSLIVGGSFNGQTGTWSLTGHGSVAPVPVPAAAWLLGSGLLGLVGVARRKKAA